MGRTGCVGSTVIGRTGLDGSMGPIDCTGFGVFMGLIGSIGRTGFGGSVSTIGLIGRTGFAACRSVMVCMGCVGPAASMGPIALHGCTGSAASRGLTGLLGCAGSAASTGPMGLIASKGSAVSTGFTDQLGPGGYGHPEDARPLWGSTLFIRFLGFPEYVLSTGFEGSGRFVGSAPFMGLQDPDLIIHYSVISSVSAAISWRRQGCLLFSSDDRRRVCFSYSNGLVTVWSRT